MAIEIKEVHYDAWGNCLRLSNGFIETIVSIDYGPRVVSFRLVEGKNVCLRIGISRIPCPARKWMNITGQELFFTAAVVIWARSHRSGFLKAFFRITAQWFTQSVRTAFLSSLPVKKATVSS